MYMLIAYQVKSDPHIQRISVLPCHTVTPTWLPLLRSSAYTIVERMAKLARAICHTIEKRTYSFFFFKLLQQKQHSNCVFFFLLIFDSIEFRKRLENDLVLSRLTPLRSTGLDQKTWPVEENGPPFLISCCSTSSSSSSSRERKRGGKSSLWSEVECVNVRATIFSCCFIAPDFQPQDSR